MGKKVEIGYICYKGHFVFKGDPDDSCGTKEIGKIYAERNDKRDKEMFEEALEESLTSHHRKMDEWQKG